MITIGVESDEEEAAVIAAMADGSLEAALGREFVIRKASTSGVGYILPAGQTGCAAGGSAGTVTISDAAGGGGRSGAMGYGGPDGVNGLGGRNAPGR